MSIVQATRYHDFSAGHRVYGHESKCANIHGHNYRVHFFVRAEKLDKIGRVLDFSCIKEKLCNWLEENWDHNFLVWESDPLANQLRYTMDLMNGNEESVVKVPFNPTAENIADYLLYQIGPTRLVGTGCQLVKVIVEETRKCFASAELSQYELDRDDSARQALVAMNGNV